MAAAAPPAVAPAPRTLRPRIGTRARPRPEDRLPPTTRWPAPSRYPRGQTGMTHGNGKACADRPRAPISPSLREWDCLFVFEMARRSVRLLRWA